MVDQLNAFAGEVTRVAREVGTEGRLGGQANVRGVAGTWKDLTDSVNSMANNLTAQVRNIADVATAIARGDLGRKITVDVKGEILELKNTINTMVDQLNAFAAEVTRVAREVGTEGKLGGQAQVQGVAGTWKDLTDNVNFMASNLTAQVRNIAEVATAIAGGDLSKKITVDVRGEILLLKETLNTMVEQLRSFAAEVTRVAREVGTDGRLGGQAVVPGVGGTWKDLTDNVNLLAANLTTQVRNIAEVTTAVARGDLSRKITVDVKGEILELKNTINTMVDQLNAFAAEVTRVAREVGTEGLLGGQAQVPGVAGTWKDLTDNVNVMAANLTEQVRGIVKVVTAVANGNLEQNLTVKAKGEVAALADTINNMTGTLATFADQVTSVAREVGVEGRLGGQAAVPGAAGTWKDLTGNVNLLAANLTTQVRAIAEVATAVTKGDLTRSIQVDARGEVAELKDNINTMIDNLRLTTDRNTEQDWLKTNLARFTGMLQGQRDLATVGKLLLTELVPLVNAHQGVIYQMDVEAVPMLRMLAGYAETAGHEYPQHLRLGEGFIGQCARDMRRILVSDVPSDTIPVGSVFFHALPRNLVVLPVIFEGQIKAVIGLASLGDFSATHLAFLEQLTASIGILLNSIEATMQTEGLLKQSQQLAGELQTQQKELQQTNEQLAQKAQQLAEQNVEVERKNQEIEQARRALEDKAEELALTSGYKSEFLANMSHELRTPLNSILILGQQLSDNPERNLTPKQVEFARTIHGAGTDLAQSHHRHSRPVEDRVGHRHRRSGRDLLHEPAGDGGPHLQARRGEPRAVVRGAGRPEAGPQHRDRLEASAAGAEEPAVERLQVHVAGRRAAHRLGSRRRMDGESSGSLLRPGASSHSRSRTPASAFRPRSSGSSSKRSSRPTPARAGSSAEPGWAWRSAASCRTCSAARFSCAARRAIGSTFTLYLPLRYAGPSVTARSGDGAGGSAVSGASVRLPAVRASERPTEVIVDDRDDLRPDDATLLIVEDDPHYARIMVDLAHDKGFKVLVAMRGSEALSPRAPVQPDGGVPRRVPAGHARVDRAQSTEAEPGHAAYPRADRHARGGSTARPRARRLLLRHQADDHRGSGGGDRENQVIRRATPQASAGRRRQRRRAVEHHRTAGSRRSGGRGRRHRRRRAGGDGRAALRLCRARSYACQTCQASRCSSASARTTRWRTFPSSCSPAGNCRRRRMPSCTRSRAAWWSRASSRPSVCSTRPRCSSIASSRTCRPRNSGCSSGSIDRTRIWSAKPCWSWTTTSATSSR